MARTEGAEIRYPAYIETGLAHGAVAYVFRYPGLFADARTPEEALAALPDAVRAEHGWLAQHGAPDPAAGAPVEIEESERIDLATDVRRGIWRGLFRYELRPTSDADLGLVRERLRWMRADVNAALDRASAARMESLSDTLVAHAEAERDLMSKLGTRIELRWPESARERLEAARAATEARLDALLPGDRERLAVFDGEKWTARKVLRCLAVAERRLLGKVSAPAAPDQSPR